MRFWVEADRGDLVEGWVVPDNPIAVSRVRVSVEGRRVAEVGATATDASIRERGWHATGVCGFRLTERELPDLPRLAQLEIHDADTNVLVHRRARAAGLLERRVVLLSAGVHREMALESTLHPHFRQCYFGLGRLSGEILTALFEHPNLPSCLMSGAFAFPRYAPGSAGNGLTAILVHEPFVELAMRLLWLRDRAGLAEDATQSWRLGLQAETARLVAGCDLADPKGLRHLLRTLPLAALPFLDNPLTRLLSAQRLADRVLPDDAKSAFETLLRIDVIGHREHAAVFAAMLFERLGIEAEPPDPEPIPEAAHTLADRLRRLDAAREIVAFDEELSDAVRSSVARNWGA